jgi:hypothetical protein
VDSLVVANTDFLEEIRSTVVAGVYSNPENALASVEVTFVGKKKIGPRNGLSIARNRMSHVSRPIHRAEALRLKFLSYKIMGA